MDLDTAPGVEEEVRWRNLAGAWSDRGGSHHHLAPRWDRGRTIEAGLALFIQGNAVRMARRRQDKNAGQSSGWHATAKRCGRRRVVVPSVPLGKQSGCGQDVQGSEYSHFSIARCSTRTPYPLATSCTERILQKLASFPSRILVPCPSFSASQPANTTTFYQ
jgi:hypothetical protein